MMCDRDARKAGVDGEVILTFGKSTGMKETAVSRIGKPVQIPAGY